jgi:hypothetical protein
MSEPTLAFARAVEALTLLRVARYAVRLRALSVVSLSGHLGSTLRGALGYAFKASVCVMDHRDCATCLLRDTCAYSVCFESPTPASAGILRRNSHRPHPFVLEPPVDVARELQPGDDLAFRLTLVGRGCEYLPYFVLAFRSMGEAGLGVTRARMKLEEVVAERRDQSHLIYRDGCSTLAAQPAPLMLGDLLMPGDELARQLTLHLVTPARLQANGRLVRELDFAILFSRLLDRLSSLSRFYAGTPLGVDFRAEKEAAQAVRTVRSELHWVEWERFSTRQQAAMKLGGIVGRLALEGSLGRFMPYLRLGECVHVGNGTAFGLGEMRVETPGGLSEPRSATCSPRGHCVA